MVEKGCTVLQACEYLNIEIPRFCYHKELSIAGNCRMCLVEIEKFPKPVASCAMPLADNMVIYVDTPLVRKARESVLEFLLINHPLDCPICDQGGECDLQDQTIKYGSNQSRFLFKYKRGVEDKNFGPLIKTVMTRCIHCTRCVRYADEIAGVGFKKEKGCSETMGSSLGTSGRGTHVEIGFYIDRVFNSELSGNVIDLCPVGALTSKPQAFEYRSWELETHNTVDTNDGLGIPIQVDVKDNKIVRIKPSKPGNCPINETWISDKVRYNFDGLNYQRMLNPAFRNSETKIKLDWWFSSILFLSYFTGIAQQVSSTTGNTSVFLGNVSCDSIKELSTLTNTLSNDSAIESLVSTPICLDFESDYKELSQFSSTVPENDFILIVSNNLRYEFPNLNIKLKNLQQKQNATVGYIGTYYDNTYNMEHLGLSFDILEKILKGKHKYSILLKNSKNPKIIIGSLANLNSYKKGGSSNQFNTESSLKGLQENLRYVKNLIGSLTNLDILFLPTALGSTGAMDMGIKKAILKKAQNSKKGKTIHLLKTDNLSTFEIKGLNKSMKNGKLIVQGHHYSEQLVNLNNVSFLDIPTVTSFEAKQNFISLEGRCRSTNSVIKPEFNTKNNQKSNSVLLGSLANDSFFFQNLNKIQNAIVGQKNNKTKTISNYMENVLYGIPAKFKDNIFSLKEQPKYKKLNKLPNTKLNTRVCNFYKTDLISQNSTILAKVNLSNFKIINKNFS